MGWVFFYWRTFMVTVVTVQLSSNARRRESIAKYPVTKLGSNVFV